MKAKIGYIIILTGILIGLIIGTPQPSMVTRTAPVIQVIPAVTTHLGSQPRAEYQLVDRQSDRSIRDTAVQRMHELSAAFRQATTTQEKVQVKIQTIQFLNGLMQQRIGRAGDAINALKRSLQADRQTLQTMQQDRKTRFQDVIAKGLASGALPNWMTSFNQGGLAEAKVRMDKFHNRYNHARNATEQGLVKSEAEAWLSATFNTALQAGNVKVQMLQKQLGIRMNGQQTLINNRTQMVNQGAITSLQTGQLPSWALEEESPAI